MNYSIRCLAAAAALASLSVVAQADVVVQAGSSYNGAYFSGSSIDWDYSSLQVQGFNVLLLSSQAIAPASINHVYEYDPDIEETVVSESRLTAPVTAIGVNGSSQITSLYIGGGVTWTLPRTRGIAQGGSFSITNLNIDLSNKRVYASITGNFTGAATGSAGTPGGAITTLNNFQLWNISTVAGNTTWPTFYGDMYAGIPGINASGLSLTEEGYNHLVSALRLANLGKNVLTAVNNEGFGSIATPVPEASSVAMATSGMALLAFLSRRRARASERHATA